jgi:phytoene synthase
MSEPGAHTRLAYRECESLTRAAAGNFYYGIGLLPAAKRRAMCAVYAYARRVDDIGDGDLPAAVKLARLETLEHKLAAMSPADPDLVMAALADARARFALPDDALTDVIEGVRMDVRGTVYERFGELELYCRRVAGSIGRLCLAIFGVPPETPSPPPARRSRSRPVPEEEAPQTAREMADALGVALQLVNTLRDIREDVQRGRVYLPAHDLVRYHLHDDAPLDAAALLVVARAGSVAPAPIVAGFGGDDVSQLFALMRFQGLRARDAFHRGFVLLGLLDRRSAACVLAMAGIYLRLLERIEERPDRALAGRLSLSKRAKAWVAARALFGHGVPERHPAERLPEEEE